MKTFRVCHSSELPVIFQRDPNYIYFLYDKLTLFDGQNLFYDHFAIVDEMPDEPLESMWYICTDGKIRSLIDYSIQELAEIEDDSMIELLLKAGTIFFYEARRRYLDPRRQLLELPYLNGSYQMSINLANNIILDENTVIAFNPETSEFEVSGKPQDYDLIFTHDYKGIDTDTVSTDVTDRRITTNIKISEKYNNIIKTTTDGLYAAVVDRVTIDNFNDFLEKFENYRSNLANLINVLETELDDIIETLSPQNISVMILNELTSKYSEIEEALSKLDDMASKFDGIEERCINYADTQFNYNYDRLSTMIDDATENPWEDFGDLNPIIP